MCTLALDSARVCCRHSVTTQAAARILPGSSCIRAPILGNALLMSQGLQRPV